MVEDDPATTRKLRWACVAGAITMAVWLLRMILRELDRAYFQDDMVYWIPAVLQAIEGKGLLESVRILAIPTADQPEFGLAGPNLTAAALMSWLGPQPKYFGYLQLAGHFAASIAIYALGVRCRLPVRASFAAALLFLAMFPHFDAYYWGLSHQHLLSICLGLWTFCCLLTAEDRLREGGSWRSLRVLALGASLTGSLFRGTFLAFPLSILLYLLLAPSPGGSLAGRFSRWAGTLAASGAYPLLALGFGKETYGLERLRNAAAGMLGERATQILSPGLPAACVLIAMWILGIAAAWSALRVLDARANPAPERTRPMLGTIRRALLALGASAFVLACWEPALESWIALSSGVFDPIGGATASAADSRWHLLRPQPGLLGALGAIAFLAYFAGSILPSHPRLLLLAVGYGIFVPQAHWDDAPSRYHYYLSPLFAIAAGATADRILRAAAARMPRIADLLPGAGLALLLALAGSNLVGIRLAIQRHRLADHFLTYDYIRAAEIIRDDLRSRGIRLGHWDPARLRVTGVAPDALSAWDPQVFGARDASRLDSFRHALVCATGRNAFSASKLNETPSAAFSRDDLGYRIEDAFILGPDGKEVDPFLQGFREALAALEKEEDASAARLLDEAILRHPHLLRFISTDEGAPNPGLPIRSLLLRILRNRIGHGSPDPQALRIAQVATTDLDAYATAVSVRAALALKSGDECRFLECVDLLRAIGETPETLSPVLDRAAELRRRADLAPLLDRLMRHLERSLSSPPLQRDDGQRAWPLLWR